MHEFYWHVIIFQLKIYPQVRAFTAGLNDVIPIDWVRLFDAEELQTLISGADMVIDVNDLKQHTFYIGSMSQYVNLSVFVYVCMYIRWNVIIKAMVGDSDLLVEVLIVHQAILLHYINTSKREQEEIQKIVLPDSRNNKRYGTVVDVDDYNWSVSFWHI